MIQEFALDPDLFVSEYQNNSLFFREAFGPESIRFLSCFPKRWRKDVLTAIRSSPINEDELAKRAILAFADSLLEKAISRKHGPLAAGAWLAKAEQENQTVPFHAILANTNPNRNASVVEWSAVPGHPKWNAPRAYHPSRSAAALASIVEPLLMRAREVIFVDPYFDIAVDEYRLVFEQYLSCIRHSVVTDKPRITIITGLKKVLERGIREPSEQNKTDFEADCRRLLPGMLSPGSECTVAILKAFNGGQQLHNRFILTKNVAIKFGIGLGCAPDRPQACDDLDVTVYPSGQSPWELYNLQRQPPAFETLKQFTVTTP
ncbi:hypothetical protein [Oleidesulfovibrio alaskensis]|jgi:hypothetical protein